jgi:microcystin-dependent protein
MAAQPFIGEIALFAGNFAPLGFAFCNGQLLSIADYDALFALIGTTYGGDGQTTFALPDLRGRVPIHQGTNVGNTYVIGQLGGAENVTLNTTQIPAHTHAPVANSNTGNADTPSGNVWAKATNATPYGATPATLNLNASTIGNIGGGQAHSNMIPFIAVNYIISLFGIFPSPN